MRYDFELNLFDDGTEEEFFIDNQKVIITEEVLNYIRVEEYFEWQAKAARESFINQYMDINKSMEDVSRNAYVQGLEIIAENIQKVVEDLLKKGFYNIDDELFVSQYYVKYCEWQEAFNFINDQYMDIVLEEEAKDEYRKYRRENRSRWQGGGFGIEGAIKGAAKAGALNMASGTIHGAFNLGGKLISSVSAMSKVNKLFKDKSTLETLANGVYDSIFIMHKAYIDFMQENDKYNIADFTENMIKESKIIMNNIKKINIDNEEKIKLLVKAFNLYPYNLDIYEYIIDYYGDRKNEIQEIAGYFNADLDEYKNFLVKNLYSNLETETEEKTKDARKKLVTYLNYLGIDNDNEYLNMIDNKLTEFDIKAKKVFGIEFASREEATIAKQAGREVEELFKHFNYKNIEETLRKLDDLEKISFKSDIFNNYMDDLRNSIEKYEIELRTVDGILFEDIDSGKLAREEKNQIDEIVKNIKEDENIIQQTKEAILGLNFKTQSIVNKNIMMLDEKIEKIQERELELATTIDKTKKEYREHIIIAAIIDVSAIIMFIMYGIFLKIMAILIVWMSINYILNDRKKIVESKRIRNKLEKQGKLDINDLKSKNAL